MTASQPLPDKPLTPRHAWQPFTPRGIAAFGVSSFARLVIVQVTVALLVIFALLWCLRLTWLPVMAQAIQQLPNTGAIRHGELNFPGASPQRLAENAHLAIIVDVSGARSSGQIADVEVTFEKSRVIFRGALGAWWQKYNPNYAISFNRAEVQSGWDAWRWVVLTLISLAMAVFLFASWWTLSFLYTPLVKFIAFFADRGVTWRGAWRLSGAALMPGACLMALGLVLYGFHALHVFHFGLLFALHGVVGLVFVCTSPFFLPRLVDTAGTKNPFSNL